MIGETVIEFAASYTRAQPKPPQARIQQNREPVRTNEVSSVVGCRARRGSQQPDVVKIGRDNELHPVLHGIRDYMIEHLIGPQF